MDISGLRHLSIEIGPRCNKAQAHDWCPAHTRVIDQQPMSTSDIATVITDALSLGFQGWVSFHYYNEPSLYEARMAEVMDAVPEARYWLWSNGAQKSLHDRFDRVTVTDYDGDGNYPVCPDNRLANYTMKQRERTECWRPQLELIVDYAGNVKLCCQDWRGVHDFGNVTETPFGECVKRWSVFQTEYSPVCNTCLHPQDEGVYRTAMQ